MGWGSDQVVRAVGIAGLHLLQLVEVLLHGQVDLRRQLMLQDSPGRLKGHMLRLQQHHRT